MLPLCLNSPEAPEIHSYSFQFHSALSLCRYTWELFGSSRCWTRQNLRHQWRGNLSCLLCSLVSCATPIVVCSALSLDAKHARYRGFTSETKASAREPELEGL